MDNFCTDITWTTDLAYAVGLITSDGSLSKDGRHIDFTSKDIEQIYNFKKALGITCIFSMKKSGSGAISYRVQFSHVRLYRFLTVIGLRQNKSMSLQKVTVPTEFFWSFLRGVYDGDGSTSAYSDKRCTNSFMCYVSISSGSKSFLEWISEEIMIKIRVGGHITTNKSGTCHQLKYSTYAARDVMQNMYQNADGLKLRRKYLKNKQIMSIIGFRKCAGGEIGRHTTLRW